MYIMACIGIVVTVNTVHVQIVHCSSIQDGHLHFFMLLHFDRVDKTIIIKAGL